MIPSFPSFRFPKRQHLTGVKAIGELFETGKARAVYPVRMVFLKKTDASDGLVRAGFSVSKKIHKKATDRNLLKRRMRESYRMNKYILEQGDGWNMDVMFIYTASEILPFATIEKSMVALIKKLGN